MRETRVYSPQALHADAVVELDARAAGHLVRVLRLRAGDPIVLFDGQGGQARAELVQADKREGCRVRILQVFGPTPEPKLEITLVQALARGDKMDWIIQKSVELGVATIRPITSGRCEVRLDQRRIEGRMRRWNDIMIGACEQSGRTRLARLHAPESLARLDTGSSETNDERRFFLEPGAATSFSSIGAAPRRVVLAVGPEGGWDENDLDQLATAGFEGISMGPRILRTETAGPAAITALGILFGDLG